MSAHGPKKEYGLQGFAGLVQKTRARSTGTEVGLYAADQAGMESDPETPWCTVCEAHNTLVCHTTLALARSHASWPEGWCEECRDDLEVIAAIGDDEDAIAAAREERRARGEP